MEHAMTTFATITASGAYALHPTADVATAFAEANDNLLALSADHLSELNGPVAITLFALTATALGIPPVKRFATRDVAARRIWTNLVALSAAAPVAEVPAAPAPQPVAQTLGKAQPKAQRRSKGITIAPKAKAKACKVGTKQAVLVDLLHRSGGASMAELREALSPWQVNTIKSGLSWDMGSLKGYGIRTTHENGYQRWLATDYAGMGTFKGDTHPDDNSEAERAALLAQNIADGYDPSQVFAVYHLVLPEGMKAPVPHIGGPHITVADKMNLLVFGDPLPGTKEATQ